jgi:hypothetical protein
MLPPGDRNWQLIYPNYCNIQGTKANTAMTTVNVIHANDCSNLL